MHILLINNNPIVSELISLSIDEMNMHLEEVADIHIALRDNYDVVCIDEGSYSDALLEHLNMLTQTTKIFLSTGKNFNDEYNLFHVVVKKPFLPASITDILEKEYQKEKYHSCVTDDAPSIFPLATEESRTDTVVEEELLPSVLNTVEIDQIKVLLDLDNKTVPTVSSNDDEEKSEKEKKKKRKLTFEEKLLRAVTKMKKKKIKKLLKLADVTIKIKFKDK